MFDVETFGYAIKALVIANLVVELAILFTLIGLMNRMFEHGDHAWGWTTCAIGFLLIGDRWIGKFVPGVGSFLSIGTFIGLLVILALGWIRREKYDVTKRMIVLTALVIAQVLLAAAGVWLFFQALSLRPPETS